MLLIPQFGDKKHDGASILSGNSIVGEKENASEDDPDKYEPKMLLFNGLYYRGNWASPFQVFSFAVNEIQTTEINTKFVLNSIYVAKLLPIFSIPILNRFQLK